MFHPDSSSTERVVISWSWYTYLFPKVGGKKQTGWNAVTGTCLLCFLSSFRRPNLQFLVFVSGLLSKTSGGFLATRKDHLLLHCSVAPTQTAVLSKYHKKRMSYYVNHPIGCSKISGSKCNTVLYVFILYSICGITKDSSSQQCLLTNQCTYEYK